MSSQIRMSPVLTCLLVAMAFAIGGCSQDSSREDRAESPSGKAAAGESDASATTGESGVKLASAESPIRPRSDAAEPGTAEPGALEPPARLPAAEAPLPLDNVDAADLKMPPVKLTEHHAAMCRVRVGDKFPDLQLPDVTGTRQSLVQLFGDKLTLVVFWNAAEPTALEELADLARYHQPRFGDRGLAIVAVNTGDPAQLAAELAKEAKARFPILSDGDGAAFRQVAREQIPRTYLLDPSGTILWFDPEYSATTRRDMAEAIRYSLGSP